LSLSSIGAIKARRFGKIEEHHRLAGVEKRCVITI
jgi:hypothetical protein